MQAHTI